MKNSNLKVLNNLVKNCKGFLDLMNSVDLTDDDKIEDFFYENKSLKIFFSNNLFLTNCYNNRMYFKELYEKFNKLPEINLVYKDDVMNICYKNFIFGKIYMNEDKDLKRIYDLFIYVDFDDIVDSQKLSSYDFKNDRYEINNLCSLRIDDLVDLINQSYYTTKLNYNKK